MEDAGIKCVLIRGGEIYSPAARGRGDVMIIGERIASIGEKLVPPGGLKVETIDASGRIVTPGFIDLHVHLIGGGGENGSTSRVPEINLSALTTAGITTAIGVLGTDSITRTPEALLAKVKALRAEGLSAWMYTGAYHLPSPTITGSVSRDLALIDEVLGVKVAISDHRSSQPTIHELARLAAEARVGGMLGRKPGIVHVHVGPGRAGLDPIVEVCARTEIPRGQFLPTHVSRSSDLIAQGIEFVNAGGSIDLTAPSDPRSIVPTLRELVDAGIELERVTISSDGNGSRPLFSNDGALIGMATGTVATLRESLNAITAADVLPFSDALRLITANPADRLGLSAFKGRIASGADADILVLDQDLNIDKVFARGRLMVDGGIPVVKGAYE